MTTRAVARTRGGGIALAAVCIAMCCFVSLPPAAHAFTFSPLPGDRKCFTDELNENTRYELRYKMPKGLTSFTTVALTGPSASKMFSHTIARQESSEVFTTHAAGEYTVCFNVNKKAAVSTGRLEITYELQDERDAVFMRQRVSSRQTHKTIAATNSPSLVQASYIESSVEAIHREIQYLKQREADMRNTNENTNTRTWAFTIVTIAVVAASTFLRHYKFKSFLIKKKILD